MVVRRHPAGWMADDISGFYFTVMVFPSTMYIPRGSPFKSFDWFRIFCPVTVYTLLGADEALDISLMRVASSNMMAGA